MHRSTRALGVLVAAALTTSGVAAGSAASGHVEQRRAVLGCLASALQATTAPVVTGSGVVGSPISLTQMPTWNCELVQTSVQWFNSSGAVDGQTGTSYVPTAADRGGVVLAVVTGSVLGLVPVPVSSNAIPIPDGVGDPGGPGGPGDPGDDLLTLVSGLQLPGSAEVGQLVALTDPVWNLPGVTTTYQWVRDGVPIPGADDQSYVPTVDDAGHTIWAQVTGAVAGLPLVSVVSAQLPIPLLEGPQLSPVSDVSVGGSRKVGTTLTLSGPTWDQDAVANSYQWLRDEAPIAGATQPTYTLQAADFGHTVAVKVTGHKEGFTDNTITSDPVTPAIGDAIQFTVKPRITGAAKVGRLLTADPGQWTGGKEGSGPPVYEYQWLRDGAVIPGAVAQTYQVEATDAGRAVSVLVMASRPAYKTGRFTTSPLTVSKLSSRLSASLARTTLPPTRPAVMKLVLKVPGLASPTGAVKVLDGQKVLDRSRFVASRNGRLTLKLGKLRPGVHRLKAVYAGSDVASGATSKVVKLTVRG